MAVGGSQFRRPTIHLVGKCLDGTGVIASKRHGHVIGALQHQAVNQLAAGVLLSRFQVEIGRFNFGIGYVNRDQFVEISGFDHQ